MTTLGLFSKMNWLRIFVVLFLAFGGGRLAQAIVLDTSLCGPPAANQVRWLRSDWKPFMPFVRVCTVMDSRGRPAVYVFSVWAKLYAASKPSGKPVSLPMPLLFDKDGTRIGTFPMNFPDDPPDELIADFTNWQPDQQKTMPFLINFSLKNPNPERSKGLFPLVYNKSYHAYFPGH